jgi:hypothetical protein
MERLNGLSWRFGRKLFKEVFDGFKKTETNFSSNDTQIKRTTDGDRQTKPVEWLFRPQSNFEGG